MKLFLDSTVLMAASGSTKGGSYAVIHEYADRNKWELISSSYCFAEVQNNIKKLSHAAWGRWHMIQKRLSMTSDILTLNKPSLLLAGKDKPILFTAISCHVDVLLTLDTTDFKVILDTVVYGVEVRTPAKFLEVQRSQNRLIESN